MSKKNKFSVKKVRRVMRMKSENFEPATYEVWKVSGPRKFVKYFVTKKDAQAFIKSHTDTTMSIEVVKNLLNEIKYK
jgi:hypothetical protein